MYEKHRQGQWAEDLALTFFEKQDFRLLARNFTSYWGEIDLILEMKQEIVFVEVRLRRDVGFGGGLESITQKKQRRILKTALYFLQKHRSCLKYS